MSRIELPSCPWQGHVIATIPHPQNRSGAAEWDRTTETSPFSAERSTTELPRRIAILTKILNIFQGGRYRIRTHDLISVNDAL